MQNQRTRRIYLYTQTLTMVSFQVILEESHVILFKLREIKGLPQRSPMPGSDRILNLNSRAQLPVPWLWSAHTEEGFRAGFAWLSKPGSLQCTYKITQLHTAVLTLVASLREMHWQEAPLLSTTSSPPAADILQHISTKPHKCGWMFSGCGFNAQLPF